MNIKLLFFPLSVIILVWSVIGVTKPAWDEYKMQKGEIVKLVEEKQRLEEGVMNIKKALAEYQNLDEDTKSYVNNAIPVNSDDDNLVAELNKSISQSGVLVAKIGTSTKKASISSKCRKEGAEDNGTDCLSKASTTGVTLSAVGTYPMIKGFLGKLDSQNRIVVPNSVNFSTSNSNNAEESDTAVELINAKIQFDVFQKKPVEIKSFSKVMTSDTVLKSLLNGGLSTAGLEVINKFINSDVFMPVQVEGAGKDNLFKKGGVKQISEPMVDNQTTI